MDNRPIAPICCRINSSACIQARTRGAGDRPARSAWAALRLEADVADSFFTKSGAARTMERSAASGRSEVRGGRQSIAKFRSTDWNLEYNHPALFAGARDRAARAALRIPTAGAADFFLT
jgi:hypothetical protein